MFLLNIKGAAETLDFVGFGRQQTSSPKMLLTDFNCSRTALYLISFLI